jgi:M6 family metalloprotease-like protein
MMLRRSFFVFNIIAFLMLLVQGGYPQIGQAASPVILEGTFNIIWGDGAPGSNDTRTSYFLSTIQNNTIQLEFNENLLTSMGGPMSLSQRPVIVQGTWLSAGRHLQVQSIDLAHGVSATTQSIIGPQPWISILCKFADVPDEPRNLAYFQGMYSPNYPGLDNYWREQSYNMANLQGSDAKGWFTLPYGRSHYLPGGKLNLGAAAQDCTAVANPYVDFSRYIGINLMFNADLDGYAWGGGWSLCLDGKCGLWRVTWEPPWGYENVSTIAHEEGHGFGLPHSSGNYGQTYDNEWDVMSDSWAPCYRGFDDPVYGCIGQHTIAYHKNLLGWIPADRLYTANPGTMQTITLEQLAKPQPGNYLAAFVPIPGLPGQFYTVEARKLDGYDSHNPGTAVIIHQVDPNRDIPAHVIDIDGNGNTGDAGAMWLPGEIFNDVAHNILIEVLSAASNGFVVSINTGYVPLSAVGITGEGIGQTCKDYTFTASASPANATTPITYLWEADGQKPVTHSSGTTDTMSYHWQVLGTQTITVTASNPGSPVSSTRDIKIDTFMTCLTLNGPQVAWPDEPLTYTATVTPLTTTIPLTYTWVVDGQSTITHMNGLVDTQSFSWSNPGDYKINVNATNEVVDVSGTWNVLILAGRFFLPMVFRH